MTDLENTLSKSIVASNICPKPVPELNQRNFIEVRSDAQVKARLPELTPEELQRPYTKYFFEPVALPTPGHREKMDHPIDPSLAYGPEDINRLLNVEGFESGSEVEVGWCNLPNGAGFIANSIFYPGATAEMLEWWFVWHTLEDLRYRTWFPPQHGGIHLSPRDRLRILDESIPLRERNFGVTHYVVEDTNTGMSHIDITWHTPEQMGFDMSRYDKVIAASALGMGWQRPVDENDGAVTAPAIMCHAFYEVEGGIQHRTRFWQGYRLNAQGLPELNLPPGERVPEIAIQGLARHNVDEFSRLRAILPRIYGEFSPGMLC